MLLQVEKEDTDSPEAALSVATERLRELTKELERIGSAHAQIKQQMQPLRQEQRRRREECRFLEDRCRQLDKYAHLLEDQAAAAGVSATPAPRPTPASFREEGGLYGHAQHSSSSSSSSLIGHRAISQGFTASAERLQQPQPQQLQQLHQQQQQRPASSSATNILVRVPSRTNLSQASLAGFRFGGTLGVATSTVATGPMRRVVSAPHLPPGVIAVPAQRSQGIHSAITAANYCQATAVAVPRAIVSGNATTAAPSSSSSSSLPVAQPFQPSVFLSLARQPGSKMAAMQYLDNATNTALHNHTQVREQVRARSTMSLQQELSSSTQKPNHGKMGL